MKIEGASLLLSVYNDAFFGKLFSGLCIIPCKDIPVLGPLAPAATDNKGISVSGPEIGQRTEKADFDLPLIDLHSENSLALTHIVDRAKQRDKLAMEFLKRNAFLAR